MFDLIKIPDQEKYESYLWYFKKYNKELIYNKGCIFKHCEWPNLENKNCLYLIFGCKECNYVNK